MTLKITDSCVQTARFVCQFRLRTFTHVGQVVVWCASVSEKADMILSYGDCRTTTLCDSPIAPRVNDAKRMHIWMWMIWGVEKACWGWDVVQWHSRVRWHFHLVSDNCNGFSGVDEQVGGELAANSFWSDMLLSHGRWCQFRFVHNLFFWFDFFHWQSRRLFESREIVYDKVYDISNFLLSYRQVILQQYDVSRT